MKEASSSKTSKLTRRRFLKTTSTALVGGAVLGSLPLESAAAPLPNSERIAGLQTTALEATKQRLLNGWDYHKGSLGGIWEVWRKSAYDVNVWPSVLLPGEYEIQVKPTDIRGGELMRLFSISLTPVGNAGGIARIEREARTKPSRD